MIGAYLPGTVHSLRARLFHGLDDLSALGVRLVRGQDQFNCLSRRVSCTSPEWLWFDSPGLPPASSSSQLSSSASDGSPTYNFLDPLVLRNRLPSSCRSTPPVKTTCCRPIARVASPVFIVSVDSSEVLFRFFSLPTQVGVKASLIAGEFECADPHAFDTDSCDERHCCHYPYQSLPGGQAMQSPARRCRRDFTGLSNLALLELFIRSATNSWPWVTFRY